MENGLNPSELTKTQSARRQLDLFEETADTNGISEQARIQAWLDMDEKDYQQGLILLSRHTRNRQLVNTLSRKESQSQLDKLAYELQKLVDSPELLRPVEKQEKTVKLLPPAENTQTSLETTPQAATGPTAPRLFIAEREALVESLKAKAESQLTQVEKIILEQGQLYTQKAKLSNTLADLGDSNDSETVAKRKDIVLDILALEERYNSLAEAKKLLELGPLAADGSDAAGPDPAPVTKPTESTTDAESTTEPVSETAPAAPEAVKVDKAALLIARSNKSSQVSKAKAALAKDPDNILKQEKLAKLQAELSEIQTQIDLLL